MQIDGKNIVALYLGDKQIDAAYIGEKSVFDGGGVSVPFAFTIGQWSLTDPATSGDLSITISALPSNGGSAITAIEYSRDGGAWTSSGITSTGSFVISGLTDDVEYEIEIRAVNAVGNGPASDVKAATPTGLSLADFSWLYMAIDADNVANTQQTVNQTFAPAAVDTGADTIDFGVDLGFKAYAGFTGGGGTKVRFSSTGTLPAGLAADTDYILSLVSGTVYRVFPMATTNAGLTNMTPDENTLYAQAFANGENIINLTSQGSGTHTVYSPVLIKKLPNLLPKTYFAAAQDTSDKNRFAPTDVDGSGNRYVLLERRFREPLGDNVYDIYGLIFQFGAEGAFTKSDMIAENAQKRFIFQTHVAEVARNPNFGNPKAYCLNADVKLSSDGTRPNQIRNVAHILNDGDRVRVVNHTGSTLPTPLAEATDYWVEDIDFNYFQLYPTAADQAAGTAPILITDIGSGHFTVYAPGRIADLNRWAFFDEIVDVVTGGGNTLSPRISWGMPNYNRVLTQQEFALSGAIGRTGITAAAWVNDDAVNYVKATLAFASDSVRPVRVDTGLAMEDGTYWFTKELSSSVFGRFHKSQQDAIDSVGVPLATAVANGKCISYSNITGPFDVKITLVDDTNYEPGFTGNGVTAKYNKRLPFDQKTVFTFCYDCNNPSETNIIFYLYVNGVLVETVDTGTAKGLTPAQVQITQFGTLWNSAQGHVPFTGKWYASYYGAADTPPSAGQIEAFHDYVKGVKFL